MNRFDRISEDHSIWTIHPILPEPFSRIFYFRGPRTSPQKQYTLGECRKSHRQDGGGRLAPEQGGHAEGDARRPRRQRQRDGALGGRLHARHGLRRRYGAHVEHEDGRHGVHRSPQVS